MFSKKSRDDSQTQIEGYFGPNSTFSGKLFFESPVRIDGRVEGEVEGATLIFGEPSDIKALVKGNIIIIGGRLTGDVDCKDKVVIKNTGYVAGNIKTQKLIIEEGGSFNGSCKMDFEKI